MAYVFNCFMAGAFGALVGQFRLCFLLLVLGAVHDVRGQNGTTPDIKNIFIDRCETFQKQHPIVFENNRKNCTFLWKMFFSSFANKSSCDVDQSSYKSFLLEANHTANIKDQAMFWAFVSPFVYNFTESQPGQYVTILDLLSGYILDKLQWCWNSSTRDLDYNSCPSYKGCPYENEAVKSFWKANSEMFAGLATGKIFVMLNGSVDDGAYTNRSIFYTVEVPAMRNPPIKTMQAILVHNPGGPFRDFCTNGTLEKLKNDMNAKGIEFECVMDPPDVKRIQCLVFPQYAEYCPKNGAPSTISCHVSVAIILWVAKFLTFADA